FWSTLGTAHYRAGDWNAAIAAFDKAMPLRGGGDCFDFFFLAMANHRLGNKKAAGEWYRKGAAWLEAAKKNKAWWAQYQHHEQDLLRFRAEAAQLLGIPEKGLSNNKTGR